MLLPLALDLPRSIPLQGEDLSPVVLGRFRYRLRRQDVRGITWVMNHAASYVLLSVGIADLFAGVWMGTGAGRLLAAWIAGWWLLRTFTQAAVGVRRVDLLIGGWFALLATVHLVAALR